MKKMLKMLWRRKRPKEGLRVLTEKQIQEKLYGSHLKPEEDIQAAAERESRERAEIAREEESLKRMKAEEELVRLHAELDRAKKTLWGTDREKHTIQEKLRKAQAAAEREKRTLQEKLRKAQAAKEEEAPTKPRFRITSATTLFNLSPKIIILFLVLILVALASFRLISHRKRRPTVGRARAPISTAREELAKPYTIQICVYENKDDAEKLVNDLKQKGYTTWLVSRTSPKGKLYYNIYIGQFAKRKDASNFLEGLKQREEFEQFKDSFIRRR